MNVVNMAHNKKTYSSFLKPLPRGSSSSPAPTVASLSLSHIYREANFCVDRLANQGHNLDYDGVFIDSSFPFLDLLLLAYVFVYLTRE